MSVLTHFTRLHFATYKTSTSTDSNPLYIPNVHLNVNKRGKNALKRRKRFEKVFFLSLIFFPRDFLLKVFSATCVKKNWPYKMQKSVCYCIEQEATDYHLLTMNEKDYFENFQSVTKI